MSHKKSLTENTKATPSDDYTGSDNENKNSNNNNNNNGLESRIEAMMTTMMLGMKTEMIQLKTEMKTEMETMKINVKTEPDISPSVSDSSIKGSSVSSSSSSSSASSLASPTLINPLPSTTTLPLPLTSSIPNVSSTAISVYKPHLITTAITLKELPIITTPTAFADYKHNITTELKIHRLVNYLTSDVQDIKKNILLIYKHADPDIVDDHVNNQSSSLASLILKSLPHHYKKICDNILLKYNSDETKLDNAFIIWTEVLEMFKNTNPFHVTNLLAEVMSISHVSSIDPSRTVEKYEECSRQFKLAGTPLPDFFFAALLVNKLPSDMITIQQTLIKPGIPKMEDIYQHMKVYYESRQSKQITTNKQMTNTNSQNFTSEKVNTYLDVIATFEANTGRCFHFDKHGTCKNGDECPYLHDTSQHKANNSGKSNTQNRKNKSKNKTNNNHISSDDTVITVNSFMEVDFTDTDDTTTATIAAIQSGVKTLQLDNLNHILLDSATSVHACGNASLVRDKYEIEPKPMQAVTGKVVYINTAGTMKLNNKIEFKQTLVIPNGKTNVVSVARILDAGIIIKWSKTKAVLLYQNKELITFERIGNLYIYKLKSLSKLINIDDKLEDNSDTPGIGIVPPRVPVIPRRSNNNTSSSPSSSSSSSSSASTIPAVSATTLARNKLLTARNGTGLPLTLSTTTTPSTIPLQANCYMELSPEIIRKCAVSTAIVQTISSFTPSICDAATTTTVTGTILGDELQSHISNAETINSANISLNNIHHARLGHYGQCDDNKCEICIIAKGQRTKTGKINTRKVATSLYQRLHMDLIGPMSTVTSNGDRISITTNGGNRYALIIVDEYTSFNHIYLLKQKSDAKTEIMNLIKLVKRQHNISVKGIHSDRGGEFLNDILKEYFSSEGIIHTTSPADTQHLNGKAEATNKTVANTSRCQLIASGAPVQLWGDSLLSAGFVRNRTNLKRLNGVSSYEMAYKTKPDLTRLRVWGANAFVYISKSQRGKFDQIKQSGMFIGYSDQQYAYRILLTNGNVIITRNVTIIENSFTNMKSYIYGDSNDIPMTSFKNSHSIISFNSSYSNGKCVDDQEYMFHSNLSNQNQSLYNHKQVQLVDNTIDDGVSLIKTSDTIIIDDPTTEHGKQHQHSIGVSSIDSIINDTDSIINDGSIVNNDYDQDVPEEHDLDSYSNELDQTSDINSHVDEHDEIDHSTYNNQKPDDEYYEIKSSTLTDTDENSDDSTSESEINFNIPTPPITSEQLKSVVPSIPSTSYNLRRRIHDKGIYGHKPLLGNYSINNSFYDVSEPEEITLPKLISENEFSINSFEDLSMKNYKQMMSRPDAEQWDTATSIEFNSLIEQNVGTEIDSSTLPKGTPIVPCRFVYAEKHNDKNEVVQRKARMVVRGDLQKDGSYSELFAPTGKSNSIKLIISHTVQNNNNLDQFDVSHAFLYAKVEEDVYIKLPDGCGIHSGKIWKLNKALYGLKQAPHAWNKEINDLLISLGYTPLFSDPCVYVKRVGTQLIILYLYVDDGIISYPPSLKTIWTKDFDYIKSKYKTKDLGSCEWILNMKVTRDRILGTITLSQEAYIKQILANSHMDIHTTKSLDNPGDPSLYIHQSENDSETQSHSDSFPSLTITQHKYYRKVLGELLYAALMTRLDIAHSVSYLSRFLATPTIQHLNAVKRILRYLVGTSHYTMIFNATSKPLLLPDKSIISTDYPITVFSDASWGNDLSDSKSTSGVLIKYRDNVICAISKKQDCVAISSTESETYALSLAASEGLWVKHWCEEVFGTFTPILLLCDNQSSIHLSSHDSIHRRAKHIRIRYHFIRDYIKKGDIIITWIQSINQQADLLTKCLPTKLFSSLVSQNLLTDSHY